MPAPPHLPNQPGPTLGAVADDVTGGTDLASAFVRAGLRTVQTLGLPAGPLAAVTAGEEVDALVVALRTRTAPVGSAVAESRAAARWLLDAGCTQLYEKYCSTFRLDPRRQHWPHHRCPAGGDRQRPDGRASPSRRPGAPHTAPTCSSGTSCCRTPACVFTR